MNALDAAMSAPSHPPHQSRRHQLPIRTEEHPIAAPIEHFTHRRLVIRAHNEPLVEGVADVSVQPGVTRAAQVKEVRDGVIPHPAELAVVDVCGLAVAAALTPAPRASPDQRTHRLGYWVFAPWLLSLRTPRRSGALHESCLNAGPSVMGVTVSGST